MITVGLGIHNVILDETRIVACAPQSDSVSSSLLIHVEGLERPFHASYGPEEQATYEADLCSIKEAIENNENRRRRKD